MDGSYPWGELLAKESGLKKSLLDPVPSATIIGYLAG